MSEFRPIVIKRPLTEEQQKIEQEKEHLIKLYEKHKEKVTKGEKPAYVEDPKITDEEVTFNQKEQNLINAVYRYYCTKGAVPDPKNVILITKKETSIIDQDQLVFSLKSRPGLILKFGWNGKKLRTKNEINERITVANKAMQRCKDEQDPLYLLSVPAQRIASVPVNNKKGEKIGNRFFMVQRKKTLYCDGDFIAQEGRLRWLEEKFPTIHSELLRQVHTIAQHLKWVDTAPVNFPASEKTIEYNLIDLTSDGITYVDKCGMNRGSLRKAYGCFASIATIEQLFPTQEQFFDYGEFIALSKKREEYRKKHAELLCSDMIKIPAASPDERKEYKDLVEMVWKTPEPITRPRSLSATTLRKELSKLNTSPEPSNGKELPVIEVTIPWLMRALVCNDTQKELYEAYYQGKLLETDEKQNKAQAFIEKLKACTEDQKRLFQYFLQAFATRKSTLDELTGRTIELEIPPSWKMNEKSVATDLEKLKGDYSFLNYQVKGVKNAPIIVVWYF